MKAFADINEINKIIRAQLITQSELPSNRVRNALTTYGATLDKLLTHQEYSSICVCDDLMLFELRTRDNDADVSMTEEDGFVTYYKSYLIYIILYGNESANISSKLIARLRTSSVRLALQDEGIFIEEVKNDTSLNEFKNDVLWHRHDIEILISCKMSISQITPDPQIKELGELQIKENNNE